MKNLFFIILTCLCCACGSGKKTVQNIPLDDIISQKKKVQSEVVIRIKEENKTEISVENIDSIKSVKPAIEPVISNKTLKNNSEAFDHHLWNGLLSKYVSKNGLVYYKGFKQEYQVLKKYLDALSNHIPTDQWSETDTLAYWMNAYNAFTIKLILDNYPLKSIKDIKNPWDLRFIKIGHKWYTLNDIEHRILRKMGDPRIHFGINCASFSCPPLLDKAFTSQNVHQELEQLTIAFINDSKRNTISSNSIQISKIFTWFSKDFTKKGSLIQFLNTYSKTPINPKAKKSFKKYNWSLNES
ncbi:DUF547 domain-containing protein [Aquimarina aquimarini]|uniref:DUF547 domain-containing protein n=1 Tax=Aquimarina aquimarini TaxID=1191734 RepID=UPI001F2F9D93|nr:DUF547 domain-containing protein [Aquimarina aquimarini]